MIAFALALKIKGNLMIGSLQTKICKFTCNQSITSIGMYTYKLKFDRGESLVLYLA